MRQKWSKKVIVLVIQQISLKGGKLNSGHIQETRATLHRAARLYFGSWENAIKKAGFNYSGIRLTKPPGYWTKRRVVAGIQRRKKAKLPIHASAVMKDNPALYSAALSQFGRKSGWRKAVKAAGFDPNKLDPRNRWSKEKVIKEIRRLESFGLPLNFKDVDENVEGSITCASIKLFGSWESAVRAAGLNYAEIRKIRKWTKQKLLSEIRRLAKRGVRLSSNFVHANYSNLMRQAKKYFGCWSQAVYAAGVDYQKHSLVWSSKAWLRQLEKKEVESIHKRTIELVKKRRKSVTSNHRKG